MFNPEIQNDVLNSIRNTLINAGLYTNRNARCVLRPNIDEVVTTLAPPSCLISFADFHMIPGESDGGGRFTKTFQGDFIVIPIMRNMINQALNDLSVMMSDDPTLGIYAQAAKIVDVLEQSYPLDATGNLSLRELPICREMASPKRYGESYEIVSMEIYFEISFSLYLPSLLP